MAIRIGCFIAILILVGCASPGLYSSTSQEPSKILKTPSIGKIVPGPTETMQLPINTIQPSRIELTLTSSSGKLVPKPTTIFLLPTTTNTALKIELTLTPSLTSLESTASMTNYPKGGKMPDQILYYEADYFQLEGIPPYPSPYVTIDSTDRFWVDMADPNLSHYERFYRTQTSDPKEGFERIEIGTGTGGTLEQCEFYEGKENCTHQPITRSLTFDDWLKDYASVGNRYLDRKDDPNSNGGYQYKGIQKDDLWGDVYVFERNLTLTASDLYSNYPTLETMIFDVALKRPIEWRREVIDQGKTILHARSRMTKWEFVERSQVPKDLFKLRHP